MMLITIGKDKTDKFCPKCSQLKPITEFHQNISAFDGLQGWCKRCYQRYSLGIGGNLYHGLYKRQYPFDGRCEVCSKELGKQFYCYHHWNDNDLNLGIWVCGSCDYLAEGLDEMDKNPFKVNTYYRLKKEVEEAEKTFKYLGPFSPPNDIYRLFLNGRQTYKWCPHCGKMKGVEEFSSDQGSFDGLYCYCKECRQTSRIGRRGGGRFYGLHKRPKSNSCELCGSGKVKLDYHHWDENNMSKGIWVCGRGNKCHDLLEAVDSIDNGNLLPDKYHKLKQMISSNKGGIK